MSNSSAWDIAGSDSFKFRRTYRKLVENTTINSATFLSTDYLNHFNELVMMLDLVPDMPEMLEEAQEWRPKTYVEHFQASVFTHKDLAIAAYDHVLDEDRAALEHTVDLMNKTIARAFKAIPAVITSGDTDALRNLCTTFSQNLQGMIDRCSGIINGVEGAAEMALAMGDDTMAQVDETAETAADQPEEEAVVMDQSAIDALFD